MKSARLARLIIAAGLIVAAGCGSRRGNTRPSAPAANSLPALTACGPPIAFTENFVRVELTAARDDSGRRFLRGRFLPERQGDHLYSQALPADGIDGAGRPTRLWLEPPDAAVPGAVLSADQPLHELIYPGFSRPFPVYPDGPVELRLPLAAATADRPVTAHVSYMACSSSGGCLPPVDDHAAPLTLPAHCP